VNSLSDSINDIDYGMGNITSQFMCTFEYCPCPAGMDLTPWKFNESRDEYWNRTADITEIANYSYIYSARFENEVQYATFE
jgi:hypothetical protein